MTLNYPELHSRIHKLSNKTKITQLRIRTRKMCSGSWNKNKEATAEQQKRTNFSILNSKRRK